MNGPRIAMVGGGSYNWSPKLLSDLMHTPELEGSEVVLLDPDVRAAEEVRAAAEAMARTLGRRFAFRAERSEAAALRGADFVLITISTGGLDSMAHDLKIPERYGIFATVGDTVGPGGWSRTLRNVPVFERLGRQIGKCAPRAIVLNYTNPMAALTDVLCRTAGLRAVGLCHGVFETYEVLEAIFGVGEKDLAVNFAGVNHFFWILDFTVKGKPGYPLLRRRLKGSSIDRLLAGGSRDAHGFHSHHALLDALLREYGYLTYAGDRHTCEFFPHYIAPAPDVLDRYNLVRTTIAQRRQKRAAARRRTLALAKGREKPFARSRETAVDIMLAVCSGRPFCDVVNLPNTGQIDNLPRGAVVETLGVVDALGFRPLCAGRLPPVLHRLVEPHCRVQTMTADAALSGNREQALQSLTMDPLCSHLPASKVRRLGLELMAATRQWLPAFR